jgi:hypothetical protein
MWKTLEEEMPSVGVTIECYVEEPENPYFKNDKSFKGIKIGSVIECLQEFKYFEMEPVKTTVFVSDEVWWPWGCIKKWRPLDKMAAFNLNKES